MKQALNKLLGAFLRKSGEPVIVLFARGNDPASRRMAREIHELFPNHPRILVGAERLDRSLFTAVDELIELTPDRPVRGLVELRRRLAGRRVELIASMCSRELPLSFRLIPLFVAPRKWLVYRPDGDRHRVALRHPIALWRFLRGEATADLFRPTALVFVKDLLAWAPALLLLTGWLLVRLRASKAPPGPDPPSTERFTVMCLPGKDFPQRLDDEVRRSTVAEVVFTPHPTLPERDTIAGLRNCLRQPGVWLVCGPAGSKHVLGEQAVAPAENESGTFCLGASSIIFLFRRDDYLRLGGLEKLEARLPGHGFTALSLLGWLRGRKTIYAGHVSFLQEHGTPHLDEQPRQPLAALVALAVDHFPVAARLLHRHARKRDFWDAFWKTSLRVKTPRLGGRRTSALIPLAGPGARVFPGRETGRRMRLAVVSPYFPSPLSDPGATRVFNLLRRVSKDSDIFLFCYGKKDLSSNLKVMLEFCARVVVVEPPTWEPPRLVALRPAGVASHEVAQMRAYLTEFASDFHIGLVQAESSKLAFIGSWLRQAGTKRVLVEHDLTFHLHQQLAGRAAGSKFSARLEAARWKRHELNGMQGFDRVVVISPRDRKRLIEHGVPDEKLRVVENGIDLKGFQARQKNPGNWRILFRGSFRHLPDLLGFRFLLDGVWPLILRERPDARLTAVTGPDSARHWKQHTGQDPPEIPSSVEMLDLVADVRPHYEGSSVVAVPTPVSTGATMTMLEALAMERPMVSTTDGCAGLGLEPGEHVLVADDPQGFAHALLRLLENPGLRQRLAQNGRRLVEQRFGWDQLAEKQLSLYEDLLREN